MENANKSRERKGAILLSCLFMLIITAVSAAAYPQLPCSFYGSATINGRPVPSGSVITAQIGGISRGSIVVSPDGKYGGETLADADSKLDVFDGNPGDEIIFYVQTPSMANRLEAGQKGTWESGNVSILLDLTFTGEEIARTEQPPAQQGGGGGNGGSGDSGSQQANQTAPANEQQFQNQGRTYDISANLSSGNVSLTLEKGDEVKFSYGGKAISAKVKSMSDFAVLFTVSGQDLVVAEKGSGQADINGDGLSELMINVGKVKDGKAETVISLLQKPAVTSGAGATGMLLTDANGLWISFYAIVIVAVVGCGIYIFRKRGGIKNESFKYSYQ